MFDPTFPRDLLFTGALFGLVAFMWAGWAHERPPRGVVWRVVLVAIQVTGLALVGFGLPPLIRNWGSPSALISDSPALVWYIVVAWIEIVAIAAIAIWLVRTKRSELIAAPAMVIVGLHFVPLTFVFGQRILMLAAILLSAVGVVAFFLPRRVAAPSFWCGILGGPVFLAVGGVALVAGLSAV
ncbi:hypothetical protein QL996_03560 [Planococcus sp. APC 4015]|nr:hypothetical protein [Planococcus sp. APC 4015]